MRKLLTAVSFAALALAGIGMGIAQPNVQVADVSYDFPTNALENDVTQRFVRDTADISYDFPTNANEDDVNMRFVGDIADVSYDYPSNEFATDESRRPPPGFQDESRRPPPDFQRG